LENVKRCKACKAEINVTAYKCSYCGEDQRNWIVRHKTIAGTLVLLVLLSIFNAIRLQSNDTPKKLITNNTFSAGLDNLKPTATPTLTVTPTTTTPTPDAEETKLANMKKGVEEKGGVVRELELGVNGTFNVQDCVFIGGTIYVSVLGSRKEEDYFLQQNGKHYFVVDFEMANFSKSDLFVDLSNFKIEDLNEGYAYNPSYTFNGKGDITGNLKPNEWRRAEIAFEVPYGVVEQDTEGRFRIVDKTKYGFIFKAPNQSVRFNLYQTSKNK
jgi:hypothetical protein